MPVELQGLSGPVQALLQLGGDFNGIRRGVLQFFVRIGQLPEIECKPLSDRLESRMTPQALAAGHDLA